LATDDQTLAAIVRDDQRDLHALRQISVVGIDLAQLRGHFAGEPPLHRNEPDMLIGPRRLIDCADEARDAIGRPSSDR
jgi:hypothetical protein